MEANPCSSKLNQNSNQAVEIRPPKAQEHDESSDKDEDSSQSLDCENSESDKIEANTEESKARIAVTFLCCIAFIAIFFSILGAVIYQYTNTESKGKI